jgi:hypothetical protein
MNTRRKILLATLIAVVGGLSMGARTFIQNFQIVQDAALSVLGQAARTDNETIISAMDDHLDVPLRLYASATADESLNIGSNQVTQGDDAGLSTPPLDDSVSTYAGATIQYQAGTTGGSGTVLVEGSAFALPTCTLNSWRRHVFVYVSSSNSIDSKFSPESAIGVSSLEDPGTTFAALSGTAVGYINLQCTNASGQYKTASTAGNSATDVIENAVSGAAAIYRFGSGAGGGAGGDTSFKLQSIAGDIATIKGGTIILSDGRELQTYDGAGLLSTDFEGDIAINLDTVLGTAPVVNTTYILAVDLAACCENTTEQVTQSDTGRKVYPIEQADFVLLTDSPDTLDLYRYTPIAYVHSDSVSQDWQGGTAGDSAFGELGRRRHDKPISNVSPVVYSLEEQTVGTVGAVANTQQALSDGDFPNTTNLHYWSFAGDSNDDGPNTAINLTQFGSPSFTSKGFFGTEENIMVLNGVDQYLEENNVFFDLNGVDSSISIWMRNRDWGTNSAILNIHDDTGGSITTDTSLTVRVNAGNLDIVVTTGASANTISIPLGGFIDNEWTHLSITHDTSAGDTLVYINGQLAGQNLAGVTYGAGKQILLVGAMLVTPQDFFHGEFRELSIHKGTILTAAEINAIYSRRFKNNAQLAGGHKLQADSFPLASLEDKFAFWNFDGDFLDDSGATACNYPTQDAACDLQTASGTPTSDGLDIFGVAQTLNLDGSSWISEAGTVDVAPMDEFLVGPAGGTLDFDISMGIWGRNFDENATWIGQVGFSSNDGLRIRYTAGTGLEYTINPGSAAEVKIATVAEDSIDRSKWHHAATVYTAGVGATAYFDGVAVGSLSQTALAISANDNPAFVIGGFGAGSAGVGQFDEAFYGRYALSDEDIKKLASSRIDLPATLRNVSKEDQLWTATYEREDQHINWPLDPQGFVLDTRLTQANKKLYVDLGDLGPGADATIKLQDLSPYAGGLNACDSENTGRVSADPAWPIAHDFGTIPSEIVVQRRNHVAANGKWTPLIAGDYCSADATEVDCDFSSLTIDATNQIFVGWSTCPGVLKVPDAEFAFTGTKATIGSIQNAQGALTNDLFTTDLGLTLSDVRYFHLDTDGVDDSGQANADLTASGVSFNEKGFFGRETVSSQDATTSYLRGAGTYWDADNGWGTNNSWSLGGWFKSEPHALVGRLFSLGNNAAGQGVISVRWDTDGIGFTGINLIVDGVTSISDIDLEPGDWHHFVLTNDGGTSFRLYIDGQLANTVAVAGPRGAPDSTSDLFIFNLDDTGSVGSNMAAQDFFGVKGTTLTQEQINKVYSRRYPATTLTDGHVLSDESFNYSSLSGLISYFPLDAASALDASGNGKDLIGENGAVGGNAIGIDGVANSAADLSEPSLHSFYSQDAYYFVGEDKSFSVGGWFAPNDTIPSVFARLFSLNNDNSDWVTVNLWSAVDRPKLSFNMSDGGASVPTCIYDNAFDLVSGHYFHVAMTVSGTTTTGYLNGDPVCSFDHAGLRDFPNTLTFRVSCRKGLSGPEDNCFDGRVDEVFFARTALSAADIKKIASTKIVHNTNLALDDQEWFVTATREDAQMGSRMAFPGIIDSSDVNVSYWDVSDYALGSTLDIELKER